MLAYQYRQRRMSASFTRLCLFIRPIRVMQITSFESVAVSTNDDGPIWIMATADDAAAVSAAAVSAEVLLGVSILSSTFVELHTPNTISAFGNASLQVSSQRVH